MNDQDYGAYGAGPTQTPWGTPVAATKKEFLDLPENAKLKKNIRSSAIVCYICAALTLVFGMFVLDSGLLSLIDVAILAGLGLGIQLSQSRVCAALLCVYAVINTIISLVSSGQISGYLIIIAGVYAMIYTFQLDKQWKVYQQNNRL